MPSLSLGASDIANVYVGSTPASKVYVGSQQVWPSGLPSFFACIDTMKDSRDTSYPVNQQLTQTQIQQEVDLIKQTGANYATNNVFFDYPSYFALWTSCIRAAGLRVWFRPHFNGWEMDNGAPQMTPSEYITALEDFIDNHHDLFEPGDIFDPNPEQEASHYWENTYGANWSWQGAPNAGTDEFNDFMVAVSDTAQTKLQQHGVTGVITGIRSVNSWWLTQPNSLYDSTVQALGYVTYDSYPDADTTDPTEAADARVDELTSITSIRPGIPVVLAEVGYSNNINVNDTTQLNVLTAELNALTPYSEIVGMNYWVGAGGAGYGGYTNIFTGTRGNWTARPTAAALKNYYDAKLS